MHCLQDYIHRVGRTARAGRSGVAISLVNQYELEWYIQIEKLIGMKYRNISETLVPSPPPPPCVPSSLPAAMYCFPN